MLQSHSGSVKHPACSFILQNQGPHFWDFNAAGDSFWLQMDCFHSVLGNLYHFQKKTKQKKTHHQDKSIDLLSTNGCISVRCIASRKLIPSAVLILLSCERFLEQCNLTEVRFPNCRRNTNHIKIDSLLFATRGEQQHIYIEDRSHPTWSVLCLHTPCACAIFCAMASKLIECKYSQFVGDHFQATVQT